MATTLHCLAHLAGFKDDSNIATNSQKSLWGGGKKMVRYEIHSHCQQVLGKHCMSRWKKKSSDCEELDDSPGSTSLIQLFPLIFPSASVTYLGVFY